MNNLKYNISDKRKKLIIDELGEEYKDLLIEHILDDLGENDADVINTSDLIRLDVTTKSNLRIGRGLRRKYRVFTMISLMGLLYSLIGVFLLIWSQIGRDSSYELKLSYILVFLGLSISIMALLMRTLVNYRPFKDRGIDRSISSYEIINKWKEMEGLIHELTPSEEDLSLDSMIQYLKKNDVLTDADVEIVYKLLEIRNRIVHSSDEKYNVSQIEYKPFLLQADEVIKKLKRIR